MIDTQYIPTIEEARAYIYAIDFSQIIDRMVKKNKWKRKDVLTACDLYKNFLFIKKKYSQDEPLPPSEDIDEFWHNHILDTQKYKQDCDRIFGHYLDHYPYLGMDGKTTEADATRFIEKTQELHHKEFGIYIYNIRSNPLKRLVRFANLLISSPKLSN